jgi:hypothetical protein
MYILGALVIALLVYCVSLEFRLQDEIKLRNRNEADVQLRIDMRGMEITTLENRIFPVK